MKKIIFTGLLLATLGTAEVTAKDFANVKVETPESVQTITTKITYSTCVVDGCTIKYKHTSYYLLGCIYLYTTTCQISRDCSGAGGGGAE